MTTRERREEYSSNVVRVLNPSSPLSPTNKNIATDFDNNLDNLLDDLNTSVIHTDTDTGYGSTYLNKSRDVQYLAPTNSTTIVQERSVSPSGDRKKIYKAAHYEYSTSTGASPPLDVQRNIDQLDNLLLDLKHERDVSLDREKNFVGIDSGLLDPPSSHITKSTKTYTSSSSGGQTKPVSRELNFESPSVNSSSMVTSKTTTRQTRTARPVSPSYEKNIETKITKEVNYGAEPISENVETLKSKREYNYSAKSKIDQQVVPYTDEIINLDTSHLPEDFKEVPLSGDLLPGPGTKVTTTIKTYTYEIPGDSTVPTNRTFSYKNEDYNTMTNKTVYPERQLSPVPGSNQTTIYKNETYNTINQNGGSGYPPNEPYREPAAPVGTNKTYMYKKDTSETTRNVYSPSSPRTGYPPPRPTSPHPPTGGTNTVIYKHDVTNTNKTVHHPPVGGVPVYPMDRSPNDGYPPGTKQTYLFKRETNNTTNTVYGPPGNRYPDDGYVPAPAPQPIAQPPYPNEPNTYAYKYSSSSTTRNVHGGHPDERQPLVGPFPTEGIPVNQVDGQPPKRLDDLLANFDETSYTVRHADDYTPKKEVNTSLASDKPVEIGETHQKIPSKNIAGPPVYYPPNHEMFTKKEEGSAAWRAQGGYAKGSGKYEYGAESNAKSSSKSGAAVIPVCLPLCCGLPCVIM